MNQTKRGRQRGITLIGFVIVLALISFGAFIGMKLFPVYSEYFSVIQAMESVAQQPGVTRQEPRQIKEMVMKRLYVSYVEAVTRNDIKISRTRGTLLQIKYEVRKPLIGNLDFVAKFDKTVELTG